MTLHQRSIAERVLRRDCLCESRFGLQMRIFGLVILLVAFAASVPLSAETAKEALLSLRPNLRNWVEQSCPRSLGPALWRNCVEREVAALRASRWPNTDRLSQESQSWVLDSCPYSLGPSLWRSCAEREISALGRPFIDLKNVDPDNRNWILQSCPHSLGPSLWRSCVEREANALGLEIDSAAAEPSQEAPLPKVAPVPEVTKKRKAFPKPQPSSLPGWSPAVATKPAQALQAKPLEAAQIYRMISSSVYLVVAGRADGQGEVSQGSAVAVSKKFAITNCHVVAGHDRVAISENGENFFPVVIVAADIDGDRCILRSESRLNAIRAVRSYDSLQVGEPVYSIGNPSGLSKTLGEGLVSGLRKHNALKLVQTSAPISPGSSGGALVDGQGNLVGITTFLLRDTQSLNFAIAAEEYWRP